MTKDDLIHRPFIKWIRCVHHSDNSVFISGTSKMDDPKSIYYRRILPKEVTKRVDRIMQFNSKILIGDCVGADKQIQEYMPRKVIAMCTYILAETLLGIMQIKMADLGGSYIK